MKLLNKKEIRYILISTLVLGFCFSFRWKGNFSLDNWAAAMVSSMIIVLMALSSKLIFQKYIANKFECDVTYDLWFSGLLLALVTTVGTLGYVIWAAPGSIMIHNRRKFRVGKTREKVHSGPYEHALIAISGIIVFFLFAVIGKIIFYSGESIFGEKLIFIGSYLALFNLIPFIYPRATSATKSSGIPTLEGVLIFFGSRPLWAFSFSFILISVISFLFMGVIPSLILALIGSFLMFVMWHYYIEPWGYRPPSRYNYKRVKKNYELGKLKKQK